MEDLLRELIAIPSVTGNFKANNALIDFVIDRLSACGMKAKRFESNGFRSAYLSMNPENKTPKIILAAHTDVVGAPSDMFDMRKSRDRYYGRGTLDMKFAIAAYIQTCEALYRNIDQYDFGVLLTSDEEVGGENGVKVFIDMGYTPEVVILPDGGYNWQIETLAKGVDWLQISIIGRSAHASTPWEGDSASLRMITLLNEIATLFPEPSLTSDTFSVGTIYSGDTTNKIPSNATATLDVRYASQQSQERLQNQIFELCAKHNAFVKQMFQNGVPVTTDLNDPLISPIVGIIEDVTGKTPGSRLSCGATDIRYFANAGTKCIAVTPNGGNHHAADEWIDTEGPDQFKEVIMQFLKLQASK